MMPSSPSREEPIRRRVQDLVSFPHQHPDALPADVTLWDGAVTLKPDRRAAGASEKLRSVELTP